MANIFTRMRDGLAHAWNAFRGRDHPFPADYGSSDYYGPGSYRRRRGNERSIVTAIENRISIDAASVSIKHVRLDQNGRYVDDVRSGLNNVLTLEANIDQTGRAFIQDLVFSMLDEGCVAAVPVDTNLDPRLTGGYDILTARVGQITAWYPEHVRVRLYNDQTGQKEEIVLPKKIVAIVPNPLYEIMNEPNSTLQRLIRKLSLLDTVDEQSSSGKLDLILQLPYLVKSDARKKQAEARREELERQLAGSKYGVAYTDGTEKVVQLNRPIENNLMKQVEYLTNMLYSQLGITPEILNGTADEQTMLNYYNRTVEPILAAITDEFNRKFLTKTARTQHQAIISIRDPFRLVPVNNIAEIADKFTRNAILSSNEIRGIVGFKPVNDKRADELSNKNLNQPGQEMLPPVSTDEGEGYEDQNVSGEYPEEEYYYE